MAGSNICAQVVGRCAVREDVYIRPIAYKSGEVIGPRLDGVDSDFMLFAIPFGNYLDLDAGIRCQTSTWRRVPDTSIPARAKVNGLYVNSALAKLEKGASIALRLKRGEQQFLATIRLSSE